MFRCVTEITIKQLANNRSSVFFIDFVHEFECDNSWEDLTNKAKVTFPKNIYVRDSNNNLISLSGTQKDKRIGELFQRGDSIDISFGYYRFENGAEIKDVAKIYSGYISRVNSKIPIELECEDNMWLLKQIPCTPQVWAKTKTVEDLLRSLLKGTNFTVNALTKTTVGDLIIQDESVGQLLLRLRKEFHLESYFQGNELRIGSVVYIDKEANDFNFVFQQNIISDELIYRRKDDVKLSAICQSINTVEDSAKNKKGQTKTKKERLEVLVYNDAQGNFKYIEKKKDVAFPANDEGERRTLFFPNVTSAKTLADYGIDELKKYYYDGFKGKFTTFGIPYVKLGDNAVLSDRVLTDRNGKYRVKSVNYKGGINGHRQTISLHYKLAS